MNRILEKFKKVKTFKAEVNKNEDFEKWVYACVNGLASYVEDVESIVGSNKEKDTISLLRRRFLREARYIESNLEMVLRMLDMAYEAVYAMDVYNNDR
jgi:hypothetical protein